MFTRIFSFALMLALAGCGGAETSNGPAPVPQQESAVVEPALPVAPPKTICAVDGAREFTAVCDREMIKGDKAPMLTLRNPSGGFRRLIVTTDGRGVIAADGSESAVVTTIGTNMIEVSIGGDRYRLPAVVQR